MRRVMVRALLAAEDSWTQLLVRLTLGIVFFPHGAQKVLGWFGGHGFAATMQSFTSGLHIPALFAFLAIAAEFLGSIALILGFFTRVAAFGILSVMLVAIFKVHASHGFFMNWNGGQQGEGFEYHLLAIGLALALLVKGAGKWSLDAWLVGRMGLRRPSGAGAFSEI